MKWKTTSPSPSTELFWQQRCGIGGTCLSEKIPSFFILPFYSIQMSRDQDIRSQQILLMVQKSNFVRPVFIMSFLNISFWPYLQNTQPPSMTGTEHGHGPALSSCSPDICTALLFIASVCTLSEARLPVWAGCALPGTVGLLMAGIFWSPQKLCQHTRDVAQPCHT